MKLHMLWVPALANAEVCHASAAAAVLEAEAFRHYVAQFNKDDEEW